MIFICLSYPSGTWNVPYISIAVLFEGEWLRERSSDAKGLPSFTSTEYEPDMTFCKWMRDNVSPSLHFP